MFSIGEFSKLSQLPIKTLRFYHDEGLLIPAFIDPDTGYRYYEQRQIATAQAISYLRALEFSLGEIAELLADDGRNDVLAALERQQSVIKERICKLRKVARSLEQFIDEEREAQTMAEITEEVREIRLEPLLVAGIRMKGKYSDCGLAFGKLGRSLGRFICGKSLLLHYDLEYREDDADFEACFPVRQKREVEGISFRELPGGLCVSCIHRGPYDQLARSYAKVFGYLNSRKLRASSPTREIYLKVPGMIFKGNPKNYLTEIQVLIERQA